MDKKKIYRITISEPWDFEGPEGKNIIRGIILSIVNSYLLVFKSSNLLNFEGLWGDILILSPRLKDENFNDLVTKKIEVNGGLLLNYDKKLEESKLKENCKFVFIGTFAS